MVFVKFHNMNKEKKFLMSPLNSNSKNFFTLQQVKTILQSQFKNVQFFFSFFNLCSDVLSILLKMSVLSFFLSFFLSFHMLCSTMSKFLLFLFCSFRLFSIVLYVFVFVFIFFLLFFSFSFHNKLLIQCPFFSQPHIYLFVFTLTR